ncbi:MAG: AGE family epimerase/isomerase [Verrucomicrobia bacterium]|nr:AGE family epimerase/isomerase [Verrucomicrobiota bacterium]
MKKQKTHAGLRAIFALILMAPGLCMVGRGPSVLAADGGVARLDSAVLRRQADRCETILRANLIPFYLPGSLDTEHGGFQESLREGRFVLTGEKFLTFQARQLWLFSTLAREGYEAGATLKAARSGFDFLQAHMLDRVHGGYYSKVTDNGGERDPRKHAYLNSFALYGLAAYYRATRDPVALTAAKDLFRVLEARAYDRENGGYQEFFHRDWRPITGEQESGYVGGIGHKTYNTHLHLLEAFAELYRIWPDDLVGRRLNELLVINTSTVRHRTFDANVDAWYRDWRLVDEPRNLRASYGHDVECAWLVLDAGRTLGLGQGMFRNWATSLAESSIRFGYDREHGGFYGGGPLGEPADDTRKTWWVEAEALVSMLEMVELTGDRSYYDLFSQTLDFVETHQVAHEGSWWSTVAADGSREGDPTRASPWHAGYHAGRAMLECVRRLRSLPRQ